MTKLLIIRHGQSEANANLFFAGHFNAELTDLGQKQAECTAQFILDNYKVDTVYSSDLTRAFKTGKAVADLFDLEVITDEGLREIYGGDWEGQPYAGVLENNKDFQHWREDVGTARPTNGESVAELYERVYNMICKIAEENVGKTVVIATHGMVIRTLELHISARGLEYLKNIPWVTNASVSEFDYENGRLYAVKISQNNHLKEKGLIPPPPKKA